MTKDKSFFYYGPIYNKLFDPQLAAVRKIALNLIAEKSSVLDIGCGTDQFCFELREQKQCHVVGLDLSLRMLAFARKSNPYQNVTFVHQDAANLSNYNEHSFDYATMLMVMHELTESQQTSFLREALRVARKVVLIDAASPLPKNTQAMGIPFVEATFGRDHHKNFKDFLIASGLPGVLQKSSLSINVEHSSLFGQGCREVLIVSTKE